MKQVQFALALYWIPSCALPCHVRSLIGVKLATMKMILSR